jgi:NADH-quinone oxidoreductase subunit F
MKPFLLKNVDRQNSEDLNVYVQNGGYENLRKVIRMKPEEIIAEIKKANLRGRGGAGFPTGIKWEAAFKDPKFPKYLVCNADEGEPGTFKDRPILEKDPHLLIEGMVMSAYAVQSEKGYIYLRAEYPQAKKILEKAIEQARAANYLGNNILGTGFNFDLYVMLGAGAYICGEETALLESIEGRRGQPRLKPPFPVNEGLWGKPTVVNNVETFGNIPLVFEIGAEEFAKIGTPESPGPKLFCVSGFVNRPGVYELPMGTTLRSIIYDSCGGIRNGKNLKAVIPGGISTPILPADRIDCAMDFANMPKAGSMLGSGAVMVFDESVCMVKLCQRAIFFFEHESCGKCTPCREGTGWLYEILEKIEHGHGTKGDLDRLRQVAADIAGKTFCPLGESAASVVANFMRHFEDEFNYHVEHGRCMAVQS